jgi:hypothetical protein
LEQLRPTWLEKPHSAVGLVATKTGTGALSDHAMREIDTIATEFFKRIKPHVQGKIVMVIDSDRTALYGGSPKPDPAQQRFVQLARAAGAIVVDTEPIFLAHIARSPHKLEVGPYDGHLNALGVGLITQAAAKALLNQ